MTQDFYCEQCRKLSESDAILTELRTLAATGAYPSARAVAAAVGIPELRAVRLLSALKAAGRVRLCVDPRGAISYFPEGSYDAAS
jgi:hypothetical protein